MDRFKGKRILVAGASSDMAASLNEALVAGGAMVGLHYHKNPAVVGLYGGVPNARLLPKDLGSSAACQGLVEDFVGWAGGIDALVQLTGDIKEPVHWEALAEEHWRHDLGANLVMPFFLAQAAIKHMKQAGGRIILSSTASASHGGGATSLAYGAAKAAVECMVKGLARDCAKYNILVNAIAPGFIGTKFHTGKMLRTAEQLSARAEMVPLKRAGTTREVAGPLLFLLSDDASYITGEVIAVSGGDWL